MIPRAFTDGPLHVGETIEITGEQGHHFARVLRVRVGEPIALTGQGKPFLGVVNLVDGKSGNITVKITEPLQQHEPKTKVHLVQGLAKGDKIDTIIQKCTEVGVAGVTIVETERSVVRLKSDKIPSKLERWRKIAWEAASQSQRDIVPDIVYAGDLKNLGDWLESVHPDVILLFDEDEKSFGIRAALQNSTSTGEGRTIVLVVGPEGGFDDTERAIWTNSYQAQLVTLGPRIMRTETAGVVGVAAVLYEYGELGGS